MPSTDQRHTLADRDLLIRACSGDSVAVNQLITAVRGAVLRYTLARLRTYSGGTEVAEDVTQDVCLAVVDVLPRLRRPRRTLRRPGLRHRLEQGRRRPAPLRPDPGPRRRRDARAGRTRPRPRAAVALWLLERVYLEAWRYAGSCGSAGPYAAAVAHWTDPAFAAYVKDLEDRAIAAAQELDGAVQHIASAVLILEANFWQMAQEDA